MGAGGLFGWDRVPVCPEMKTSESLPLFGEMIVHRVIESLMNRGTSLSRRSTRAKKFGGAKW